MTHASSKPQPHDGDGGDDAELQRAPKRLMDDPGRGPSRSQSRYRMLLNAALAALLFFAASPLARHWLMQIISNVCILGGIVAAPIVSMVAWIGLVLPTHALLHRLAPMLVATSLIWFCMAIVGSHALRLEPHGRNETHGVDRSESGKQS